MLLDVFSRKSNKPLTIQNTKAIVNADDFVLTMYKFNESNTIFTSDKIIMVAAVFPSKQSLIDHTKGIAGNNPIELINFQLDTNFAMLNGVFEYDNSFAVSKKLTDLGKVAILQLSHNGKPVGDNWHNHELIDTSI